MDTKKLLIAEPIMVTKEAFSLNWEPISQMYYEALCDEDLLPYNEDADLAYENPRCLVSPIYEEDDELLETRRNNGYKLLLPNSILESGATIANAIMASVNVLASSIHQLTDEIERKNKLDEFYSLLNKIDDYEDSLIKAGKLEEAYENMSLVKYPLIKYDDRHIFVLMSMTEEVLEQTLSLAAQKLMSPLVIFENFIVGKNCWYGNIKTETIYIKFRDILTPAFNVLCFFDKEGGNFGLSLVNEEQLTRSNRIILGQYISPYEHPYFGYLSHPGDKIMVAKLIFKKNFIETLLDNVNKNAMTQIYHSTKYVKLVNFINSLNRDIQLTNLRSLCMNLRNAVRMVKITK